MKAAFSWRLPVWTIEKRILKGYGALAFLCLVWGTTYLALRIGVSEFPAFIFSGIRNTTAGLLLLFILPLLKRRFSWSWKNVRSQIFPGIMMVGLGNGIVGWAEKYIDSGLAALLCSMVPIYVVLINIPFQKQLRINWQIAGGLLLGLAGIAIIFRDNIVELANPSYFYGILLVLGSSLCWAIGSVYTKERPSGTDPFYNAALQLFWGGLFIFLLSLFNHEWSHIPAISTTALLALLYLIIFGSMMAFMAYLYALSVLPVGLATVYAYINPLIAILLGFLILNEKLTVFTLLAFAVTMGGVYLIKMGYKHQEQQLKK